MYMLEEFEVGDADSVFDEVYQAAEELDSSYNRGKVIEAIEKINKFSSSVSNNGIYTVGDMAQAEKGFRELRRLRRESDIEYSLIGRADSDAQRVIEEIARMLEEEVYWPGLDQAEINNL